METINTIELRDETIYPDETILKNILGASYPAYAALLQLYDEAGLTHEWRYYHDGKAWLCKVQKKAKTIVWMSAWQGYMQATLYIPEKHIEAVCQLPISDAQKEKFRQTKPVGKSKPCIFEVRTTAVLKDFSEVMHFKLAAV